MLNIKNWHYLDFWSKNHIFAYFTTYQIILYGSSINIFRIAQVCVKNYTNMERNFHILLDLNISQWFWLGFWSNPLKYHDLLLSLYLCNFFHRSHSPTKLYVFEKYSSRSLQKRCLFEKSGSLRIFTGMWSWLSWSKNPNLSSAPP